jgi:hypothetical protein
VDRYGVLAITREEAVAMKLYRDFTSQEEIDQEYKVEALVPDMAPYFDLFVG